MKPEHAHTRPFPSHAKRPEIFPTNRFEAILNPHQHTKTAASYRKNPGEVSVADSPRWTPKSTIFSEKSPEVRKGKSQ